MRNGNGNGSHNFGGSKPVLILPMRNGNKEWENIIEKYEYGSYPTYEEWKHEISSMPWLVDFSSYPTYEEWKLYNWGYGNVQHWLDKFLSYL